MPEKTRRSNSVYDVRAKQKNKDLLDREIHLSGKQLTFGIIIGVVLTIITIALQCVAFFTPHWKEISPNTHSLYVDSVDALIRTETLVYFNSIYRFNHHSYGLFQQCEYPLTNLSKFIQKSESIFEIGSNKYQKTCTKNFLPSFEDEQFDECHSLPYYRFCSKANEKNFNVNHDYLEATFDVLSDVRISPDSTSSCNCHYPAYVKACHILGIFALIFLTITAILFGSFPFLKTRHQRLKVKCFGVLSSLLSTLFLIINLLVVLNHLEYESTEYLIAIERHYRSSQIYKLSQDTTVAIDRFLSSIHIEIGYSTIIAWIAFVLSIIDGILLTMTCKMKYGEDRIGGLFTGLPRDSTPDSQIIESEEYQASSTLATYKPAATIAQLLPPPLPPQLSSTIVINDFEEQSKYSSYTPISCLKRTSPPRPHFEDVV